MTPPPPSPFRDALAVILVAPAPLAGVVLAGLGLRHPEWGLARAGEIAFVAGKAWMLLAPLGWRLLVDRRRLSFSPARAGGFGLGALSGLAISVVIVAAYALLGTALIEHDVARSFAAETGLDRPARYLGLVAFWVLANSVLEEYVYRWFLLEKTARLGAWGSAIASSLLFTLHHVVALRFQFDWLVTILGSLGVFAGGMIWCGLSRRARSIWPAYLSHAIVDVAVFAVGAWIIYGPGS